MADDASRALAQTCPKRMVFGPCADLDPHGGCEVPGVLCPFIAAPAMRWPAPEARQAPPWADLQSGRTAPVARADGPAPRTGPLIICELPEPGNDGGAIRTIARRLATKGSRDSSPIDAVLFGDTNFARTRFPPSYRAALVQQEGLVAWPGLNARDRNRVALEGELLALADLGVAGVHCVTGNHPHSGDRPDAAAVFDLDATRLAALAASLGLCVSVAASPHTPPVAQRVERTADKAAAGASWVFVDQPTDPAEVAAFVNAVRRARTGTGARGAAHPSDQSADLLRFAAVVTVPLFADDLTRLLAYPNARVPTGWVEAMHAATPKRGADLAAGFAQRLLATGQIEGIVLGATSGPQHADTVADAFVEVAGRLRHHGADA